MSKLVGLQSGLYETLPDALSNNLSNLKQQALLFDQIGVLDLMDFFNEPDTILWRVNELSSNISKLETVLLELEWLQQTGIIFDLNIRKELQEFRSSFLKKTDPRKNFRASIEKNLIDFMEKDINKIDVLHDLELIFLRSMPIIFGETKSLSAVTTLPHQKYTHKIINSQKSDVAQIIINKLPIPNSSTPWEKIIDYRNDPESKKHLLGLRRWISQISTKNLSLVEIEEELEWLLNEFQNHMKIHQLKANTEAIEVMIKTPLEIIENTIKLKFSKISDPLFALNKRRVFLMEAELNSPGREMAYIIKSRKTFQSEQ